MEQVAQDHLLLTPAIESLNEPEGSSLTAYLRDRLSLDSGDVVPAVVMDLSQVNQITSPAIGAFILLHKRLSTNGVSFILLNLGPMLVESLLFLKLDQVLTICQTPDEMRQALNA